MDAPPPIAFPFFEGETENFPLPPKGNEKIRKLYKTKMRTRRWMTRDLLSQTVKNARRPGHGKYVFVIIPDSFEKLMTHIELRPGYRQREAVFALREQYYLGKKLQEIDTDINAKTLTRYLQAAERAVDILGENRDRPFRIGLATIRISHRALRFGRDARIDIQKYFTGRIF